MKHLEFRIRFFLIVLLALFTFLFIWWLPYFSSYINGFFEKNLSDITYTLGAFIAIPTVAIFGIGLAFPKYISNDQIFSKITADLLKIIHIILGITCFLLCILGIILFAFREALFSFVFIGVGFIGMLVSLMLRVLSLYVRKAAILKEEADATL